MLKYISLSILSMLGLLMAASPMVSTSMSTDNGGTKLAIDAYSDGAGVLLINQASDTKVDNSAMNKLVFKYGDAAKTTNTTLKNQVNVLSPSATALEKAAATTSLETAKLALNPPVNGTPCDDGNPNTANEVWSSGVCSGPFIDGVICNDSSSMTLGDKYTSNICSGTYITSCKVIKTYLPGSTTGNYTIDSDGSAGLAPFTAYCDMATDGGGWTKVYSMSNGVVTFNMTKEYTKANGLAPTQLRMVHPSGRSAVFTINDSAYKWFDYRDSTYSYSSMATVNDSRNAYTDTALNSDGTGSTTAGLALFVDTSNGAYVVRPEWNSSLYIFWFAQGTANALMVSNWASSPTTPGMEASIELFVR